MRHLSIGAALGFCISLIYTGLSLLDVIPPSAKDAFADFGLRSLFVDHTEKTQAEWLDPGRHSFACAFKQNIYGYYCGLDIRVGDGRQQGEDLTHFSHIRLKVIQRGEGQYLRINYRNAFADKSKSLEGKQLEITRPITTGLNEFKLPLDKFKVPYWWIDAHPHLNETDLNQQRDNVTHIGFYYEEPKTTGTHEFEILEFRVFNNRLQILDTMATLTLLTSSLILATLIVINLLRKPRRSKPVDSKPKGDIRILCEEHKKSRSSELDIYDPITGLLSQSTTINLIEQYGQDYSFSGMMLILIVLDDYDAVKSEQGTHVASEYRSTTSLILKSCIAELGVACNWDESRQLVLLPLATASNAKRFTTQIGKKCGAANYGHQALSLNVSVSIVSLSAREAFYSAVGSCGVPVPSI